MVAIVPWQWAVDQPRSFPVPRMGCGWQDRNAHSRPDMLWSVRVRVRPREALLYRSDIDNVVWGLLFIWLYNLRAVTCILLVLYALQLLFHDLVTPHLCPIILPFLLMWRQPLIWAN
ncbi:hypothetical protein IW261DRAFT_1466467 [Armillaria novae-zelandiae]|uniref:Uncharacterized protein n=1 Tax=Armillaria novae-zelandiae TaxID=153914 RepID=A0AA39PH91_9AGAR|nr:hypothetical protein IW261DRAFT_1466467 [Armillaria novae-zelandiae]